MLDYAVVIGRFQPLHNAHLEMLLGLLKEAKHLIIVVGSSGSARSLRNPFSVDERVAMIVKALNAKGIDHDQFSFGFVEDTLYNDNLWATNIRRAVKTEIDLHNGSGKPVTIGIGGCEKDEGEYYLSLFPEWQSLTTKLVKTYLPKLDPNDIDPVVLSATPIRERYFSATTWVDVRDFLNLVVPETSLQFLKDFTTSSVYATLVREQQFVNKYKAAWATAPYAPTFVTVDSVVVQAGHILLIQRKTEPGKDLFALPGGFINQKETLLGAAVRELREETRLKVPEPVIRGSLKNQKTYDYPERSQRGRTITTAFYFELRNLPEGLPKVKGSDDAKDAFWLPLDELTPDNMYEDHYSIICDLLGL